MSYRADILEGFQEKRLSRNIQMPLCSYTFWSDDEPYQKLISEKGDPTAGLATAELNLDELKHRMTFYESISAAFMDWYCDASFKEQYDSTVEAKTIKEKDKIIQFYTTPIGSLESIREFASVSKSWYIKKELLATEEDARIYKYVLEAKRFIPTYDRARKWLDAVGDKGIVCGYGCRSPFHDLLSLYGTQEFLLIASDMPKAIQDLMDTQHEKNLERCEILGDGPLKVIHQKTIYSLGLISPAIFHRYYLPTQAEYNKILHSKGKFCMDHLSGEPFAPYLVDLEACGYDCIYGIRLDGQNIDSIRDLVQRWDRKILPGIGIDPDFLRRYSSGDIGKLAHDILSPFEGAAKILLGTADDTVLGTPMENFTAISDEVNVANNLEGVRTGG